eukprot:6433615-Amphidinium_carterae.1
MQLYIGTHGPEWQDASFIETKLCTVLVCRCERDEECVTKAIAGWMKWGKTVAPPNCVSLMVSLATVAVVVSELLKNSRTLRLETGFLCNPSRSHVLSTCGTRGLPQRWR